MIGFHRRPGETGASAAEFAIVLPTFLLLVMVVFALALWLFSLLLAGTAVPTGARTAGIQHGAGAGYARLRTIMGVAQPAAGAIGETQLSLGAPGCARDVYAHLNAASGFRLPLLGAISVPLKAGSQGRNWNFWAGKPADGCE